MRRWDRLQDSYVEEHRATGLSPTDRSVHRVTAGSVGTVAEEAPPPGTIEQIDAETITLYKLGARRRARSSTSVVRCAARSPILSLENPTNSPGDRGPVKSNAGTFAGSDGANFFFRDEENRILVGNLKDRNSQPKPGERISFTAS